MQPSTHSASNSLPAYSNRSNPARQSPEDRMYQAMTIAAIIMLLGSLWVF
jgi:hypothetical protein